MAGYFITFEGSEKSGKSTQAKLLMNYLIKKGRKCVFIREPGSTSVSEKVRKILLDVRNKNISHISEMLLYMAARAQLIQDVIEPALKDNKVVICDRFLDSTIVYQGYGLGLDLEVIKYIGRFATKAITPDLTLLLDLDKRKNLYKVNHRKDRIELRSQEFHKRVWQGYLELAKEEPQRIKIVTLEDDKFQTQEKIRGIVDRCLLKI